MVHPLLQSIDDARLEYLDELPYACGTSADLSRCLLRNITRKGSVCVAVKKWRIYHNQITDSDNGEFTKRLRERLIGWRRLRHSRIVPVVGLVSTDNSVPVLVMPFFNNGNVMDYIENNPSVNILSLLLDIVSGLYYMHSLESPVIHGTLKGSNILITDAGQACISDPCINMLPVPPFWTIENAVYARWLAPEILASGAGKDDLPLASTAGDVYSLAMTAIEMYTGCRPFSHIRSHMAVVLNTIQGKRPQRPVSEDAPQLTDAVWAIIQHCWKQDPMSRPSVAIVGAWLCLISKS